MACSYRSTPLAGVEQGLPKGLLQAALAAFSASFFAPITLLASLNAGDRICKACACCFYRGTKERLDTALLGGGAALPWLMVRAVHFKARQEALAEGKEGFFWW